MNTVFVRYDKFRNKEYITHNENEFVNDFGYTLLDFLYVNVKQKYYDIIKDSNEKNHEEIYGKVCNLFNQDDALLCKLIFSYDYDRFIKDSNLCDYFAPYKKFDIKTNSEIPVSIEKPFNSHRDRSIRALLDYIEDRKQRYSLILDFCSINTAPTNNNIYNKYVNRFNYACKRLIGEIPLPQPRYAPLKFEKSTKNITLDELEKDYVKYRQQFEFETNPIDDYYYICHDIDDYFITVMFQLLDRHYIISKCKNCGKLFVPFRNNTALYCDRISPQNPNKTCKEFEGSKPKGLNRLYRKIYQKKFARVSRNENNYSLKADFEKWKDKAQKVKAKYDKRQITDDEYEKWLLENDK